MGPFTFNLSNFTPITAIWLLASALALYFAAVNLSEARRDLREAERVSDALTEQRLVVAHGAVFRNWIRFATFMWWVTLGLGFGLFDLPDIPRLAGVLGLLVTAFGQSVIGARETLERRELKALVLEAARIVTMLGDEQTRAILERTAEGTERIAAATEQQATGARGPAGEIGPAGPIETGAQGIAGEKGIEGKSGQRGAAGEHGQTGRSGQEGHEGQQGPAGAQGRTGPRNGEDGE